MYQTYGFKALTYIDGVGKLLVIYFWKALAQRFHLVLNLAKFGQLGLPLLKLPKLG